MFVGYDVGFIEVEFWVVGDVGIVNVDFGVGIVLLDL